MKKNKLVWGLVALVSAIMAGLVFYLIRQNEQLERELDGDYDYCLDSEPVEQELEQESGPEPEQESGPEPEPEPSTDLSQDHSQSSVDYEKI